MAYVEESAEPPPATIIIRLRGSTPPAAVPPLCARLQLRLAGTDGDDVGCDASRPEDPDLTTIEVLARVQLTARRSDRVMGLRNPSRQLLDLLSLVGLSEVVVVAPRSAVETGRQPEQGKQARVEEVIEPGDAPG